MAAVNNSAAPLGRQAMGETRSMKIISLRRPIRNWLCARTALRAAWRHGRRPRAGAQAARRRRAAAALGEQGGIWHTYRAKKTRYF